MEIRQVVHASDAYWGAVELRREVLRIPLGLNFTQDELENEACDTHLVAMEGGDVVGCLVMTATNCSVVKMRQVAVAPALQNQGIGSALVHAAEKWAKEMNFSEIELSAREEAVQFYTDRDYLVVGEPFIEVTIPHRKMRKSLSAY